MSYTNDDFQEWIFYISDKIDYFTEEFAKENNLKLDYSIESLDELEMWVIEHYFTIDQLKEDSKTLDLLTIYIGQTLKKYIGGKWYIDLENKENAYYSMPVLTSPDYKGEKYIAPRTFATESIDRKRGNYISKILNYRISQMEK